MHAAEKKSATAKRLFEFVKLPRKHFPVCVLHSLIFGCRDFPSRKKKANAKRKLLCQTCMACMFHAASLGIGQTSLPKRTEASCCSFLGFNPAFTLRFPWDETQVSGFILQFSAGVNTASKPQYKATVLNKTYRSALDNYLTLHLTLH